MKTYLKGILCAALAVAFSLSLPLGQDVFAAGTAEGTSIQQEQSQQADQVKKAKKQKKAKVKKNKKNKKDRKAETAETKTGETADTEKTAKSDELKAYDPARDKAPDEGLSIEETNFKFSEQLLVRPKTDAIVIHHVGIPDGDTSAASIHQAHLNNGWAGIGYHYVIRKNGVIERGRPLATVGAHAYGENYHTIGINVTGNFEREVPTYAQMKSLTELVTSLCRIYKIEPGVTTIVGHRDYNSTDCPGRNLYSRLPQLRDDVQVNLFADKLKNVHLLKLKKYEQQDTDTTNP